MSNHLSIKQKIVLELSNGFFYAFHQKMLSYIRKKQLNLETEIINFVERTDQDIYGRGMASCEITDYIHSKQNWLTFANLVQSTIDELLINFAPYPGALERLTNFHQAIVDYAKTLKD